MTINDSLFIICRVAHTIETECLLIEVCQVLENDIKTTEERVPSGIHFSMPKYPLESAYLHTKFTLPLYADVEDEEKCVEKATQTDTEKVTAKNATVSQGTQTVENLRYMGTNVDTFLEEYE